MTPAPPVALSPGQGIFWSTPTNVFAGPGDMSATNGTATASLSSAALTFFSSRPLGNWYWAARWDTFTAPSLPSGSTINAIYPVIVGYGSCSVGTSQGFAGAATSLNMYVPEPPSPPLVTMAVPGIGPFFGEFASTMNASIGSTSAAVTGAALGVRLFSTLFEDGFLDSFNVTYVGLAVYYTPAPIVFGSQPIVGVSVANTRLLNN